MIETGAGHLITVVWCTVPAQDLCFTLTDIWLSRNTSQFPAIALVPVATICLTIITFSTITLAAVKQGRGTAHIFEVICKPLTGTSGVVEVH